VVVTGCESEDRVRQALRIAGGFQPMPEGDVTALLARTAERARAGTSEHYKTTTEYDGTTQNPEWMG